MRQGLEAELEEPSFDAPNFSDFDQEESKEPSTFNPAMENLDKKEQMYATEQMVDTVLDVYGKAHLLANRVTKIKEDKSSYKLWRMEKLTHHFKFLLMIWEIL